MNKVFVCVLVLALVAVIGVRAHRPGPCENHRAGDVVAGQAPYYFVCKSKWDWDLRRCAGSKFYDESVQRCITWEEYLKINN
ncbi:hypothetical protein LSAT2_021386 [Lamellibrachia satsuma]|nr:hypothetical protein LSAT2_021386 [Lamellibrachia satsuma]